jgi:flagellin
MAVVINTNSTAIVASNNLAASNAMLQKSLGRLSSGSKIVSPADDAGGLAVSMKLSAAAKRSGAASANLGNSVSYLQTQDGALKVAGKVLERVSELKTLYADPTKSSDDLANYDTEFTQLKAQISSIATEKFNSVNLFNNAITTQVSEDGSQTVSISNKNILADTGVAAIVAGSSLSGVSLTNIKTAIDGVARMRATNGAEQSRLEFAGELLTVNKANLEAANSRIIDVDVAAESTQLARWNTLVQAGTSMLAQANGSSQTALSLLR